MSRPQVAGESTPAAGPILLTGATGYIGGRLLARLSQLGLAVRCLVRDPSRLVDLDPATTEVAVGDLLRPETLPAALAHVTNAYYLVHSMGAGSDFAARDVEAANNLIAAARQAGVRRIIYLGGLGVDDANLSPHLRSRQQVGEILRSSGIECIEFRTSIVIGTGSLSFDLVCSLTERLPVMICPRWLATPTQPIAIDDIVEYLVAALDLPSTGSRVFEVGGADVVTYGDIIREYARQRGLRRWLISVPVLTPYLSSLWLGLVTPATADVGRHLIEGLRNPTIVRDTAALEVFPIRPMGIQQAVARAIKPEPKSAALAPPLGQG